MMPAQHGSYHAVLKNGTHQISAMLLNAQECLANGRDHHAAQQPWTDFILSMLELLQQPHPCMGMTSHIIASPSVTPEGD